MNKVGRPKKWDNPRTGILLSKKKYRDKKREERLAASLVISYRCKQCGLEVKFNIMSKKYPDICIWCEYDNRHSHVSGNSVTTRTQ